MEKKERDKLFDLSERAFAASEAKATFLSQMPHEIRTPINAVLGMNEMIPVEYDLSSVINDLVNMIQIKADNKNIPKMLYSDEVRIKQVITNILTNSVKYTEKGCVTFSIKFKHIEEKRNRNVEGTGLGMAITKNLLYVMNSNLKVESIYGLGSKFSFELKQKVIRWEPLGDYEESYKTTLKERKKERKKQI